VTSVSDADAVREAWEAVGSGYDQAFGSSFTAIARTALRHADVQPGMRLLDVAGSGALTIPASALGAQVLATDLSPGMLALLHRRAHEAGVAGIQTAVMDGTDLKLEDQSFERVCSQFGVMLFPDTDQGLGEMFRVTAPGGRWDAEAVIGATVGLAGQPPSDGRTVLGWRPVAERFGIPLWRVRRALLSLLGTETESGILRSLVEHGPQVRRENCR
jgi:ubiquinone/menaquinone biosynthesis C-methylase UbiE